MHWLLRYSYHFLRFTLIRTIFSSFFLTKLIYKEKFFSTFFVDFKIKNDQLFKRFQIIHENKNEFIMIVLSITAYLCLKYQIENEKNTVSRKKSVNLLDETIESAFIESAITSEYKISVTSSQKMGLKKWT